MQRWSGLIISTIIWAVPAQAQSSTQVAGLVEALRQAAPKTSTANDGLYSDWQILPGNIPRWSKSCIGRELTPSQFEADPKTARSVLNCVVGDVLKEQYQASGQNEAIAVQRTAAWWMTGDANRFNQGQTADYTQKVLKLYQQQTAQSGEQQPEISAYDRYMQIGYTATQKKDYQTALINFQRALKQRPEDTYAQKAARNVKAYIEQNSSRPQSPAASTPKTAPQLRSTTSATATITQQQALKLINEWLQAKPKIFAPPFARQPVLDLTTGELLADLDAVNGPITWLKQNNAHYSFGVQKVDTIERFVAAGNKATLEVNVTEDRTLYREGLIDPTHTDFEGKLIRFSLQSVDGKWKIADYKTVDGSLLERTVMR